MKHQLSLLVTFQVKCNHNHPHTTDFSKLNRFVFHAFHWPSFIITSAFRVSHLGILCTFVCQTGVYVGKANWRLFSCLQNIRLESDSFALTPIMGGPYRWMFDRSANCRHSTTKAISQSINEYKLDASRSIGENVIYTDFIVVPIKAARIVKGDTFKNPLKGSKQSEVDIHVQSLMVLSPTKCRKLLLNMVNLFTGFCHYISIQTTVKPIKPK